MKLCFATNNKHKLEEVKHAAPGYLDILGLAAFGITEDLPETHDTIEGNALEKAEYVFDRIGVPCFADDSGLEVDALAGQPGVFSARFAGEPRSDSRNMNLLLQKMHDVTNRSARFRTVIALVGIGSPTFFEGIVAGHITTAPSGTGGFGYDPVFIPQGHTRTFAEMTLDEKNQLSHRSIAVAKLVAFLSSVHK